MVFVELRWMPQIGNNTLGRHTFLAVQWFWTHLMVKDTVYRGKYKYEYQNIQNTNIILLEDTSF